MTSCMDNYHTTYHPALIFSILAVSNQVFLCIQLGGAVIPHDGKCYLEPNGSVYIYSRSKELVSQAHSFILVCIYVFIDVNVVVLGLPIGWANKLFTATV